MNSSFDRALCNTCLADVACQIIIDETEVQLEKDCPVHGRHYVTISTEPEYWKTCCDLRQAQGSTEINDAPHMVILEVIDECDLACPTCIASSTVGSGNARPRKEILRRVQRLTSKIGKLKLLMISGGEPTLHPEILEILADLRDFTEQIMLITNGVRIATDGSFAADLSKLGPQFQAYLQFDSLNPSVLKALRGRDYTEVRQNAVRNLHAYKVATTLVCVIKRGLNDIEVGDLVKHASKFENIVGITFQPIRSSGRHEDFKYSEHSITLSEVRRLLLDRLGCGELDIVPHPLNPEQISIGYFSTNSWPIVGLTERIYQNDTGEANFNSIPLYLTASQAKALTGEARTLRIAIISYLDQFDYSMNSSLQGGIVFLTDDEKIVALDKRFLPKPRVGQPMIFSKRKE